MAETIAYDPKFEYGKFERYTERWRGLLQQFNKDIKAAYKNDEQDQVIAYYQEVSYLMMLQLWNSCCLSNDHFRICYFMYWWCFSESTVECEPFTNERYVFQFSAQSLFVQINREWSIKSWLRWSTVLPHRYWKDKTNQLLKSGRKPLPSMLLITSTQKWLFAKVTPLPCIVHWQLPWNICVRSMPTRRRGSHIFYQLLQKRRFLVLLILMHKLRSFCKYFVFSCRVVEYRVRGSQLIDGDSLGAC